jgi:hypothetical protein
MPESTQQRSRALGWALLACVLLACVLRLWNAWNTSFWLDDFHSLHHARALDLGAFFSSLLRDNHPPLSMLLLRFSENSLGPSEWALHTPNLIIALASGVLLWRLTAAHGRAVRVGAVAFLSFSAMHVDLSSNLRMYALLGLCVLGLLAALIDQFENAKGQALTVFWIVLGLHTHYHFLHATLLLALVSLALVFGAALYRPRLRSILISFAVGICLALPWYALGFREQLAHGLAPGGSSISAKQLATSLLHLLHQGASDHSAMLSPALLAGGALGLLLAGVGQLQLLRDAKRQGRPARALLVAACAFLLPLWTAAAAALSERAGFESRYLAGCLAPMAWLASVGAFSQLGGPNWLRSARHVAGFYALGCALCLSTLLANSSGHEDYRSATAFILDESLPGDALLAADWQPTQFPAGIGWNYYSEQLARADKSPLQRLQHDENFNLIAPARLSEFKRVHCILRSIPMQASMLRTLGSFYNAEQTQAFGRGVFVLTFSEPKSQ